MFKAWRCFDLNPMRFNKFTPCAAKIPCSPSALIRTFGPPAFPSDVKGSSGEYIFEDQYLNLYKLYDYYEVQEYWHRSWDNPEREKYIPKYVRGKKQFDLPSIEELWASEDKISFKLEAVAYSDIQGFIEWLNKKLDSNENILEKLQEEFGDFERYDDYDKEYTLKDDIAIKHYDANFWKVK